jgi:hypothetical protein
MASRARIALLLLGASLAACEPSPPREPLDAEKLHTHLRLLAGLSAESVLFTEEVAAGHLNGAFAAVHQQGLGSEVRRVAASLAQPATPQVQQAQRDAMAVATELQLQLTKVSDMRSDPAALRALQERFTQLRAQVQALEGAP